MENINSNENNNTEAEDLELLYAEDASGKRIPDTDLGRLAQIPKLLTFKVMGEVHRVEVRFDQVTNEGRRKPGQIAEQMSADAGVIDAEDNIALAMEVNEQIVSSVPFQVARAEIALSATTRDSKGRLRISLPGYRENLTAQTLGENIIGQRGDIEMNYARRYVKTVCDAVTDFFGS